MKSVSRSDLRKFPLEKAKEPLVVERSGRVVGVFLPLRYPADEIPQKQLVIRALQAILRDWGKE